MAGGSGSGSPRRQRSDLGRRITGRSSEMVGRAIEAAARQRAVDRQRARSQPAASRGQGRGEGTSGVFLDPHAPGGPHLLQRISTSTPEAMRIPLEQQSVAVRRRDPRTGELMTEYVGVGEFGASQGRLGGRGGEGSTASARSETQERSRRGKATRWPSIASLGGPALTTVGSETGSAEPPPAQPPAEPAPDPEPIPPSPEIRRSSAFIHRLRRRTSRAWTSARRSASRAPRSLRSRRSTISLRSRRSAFSLRTSGTRHTPATFRAASMRNLRRSGTWLRSRFAAPGDDDHDEDDPPDADGERGGGGNDDDDHVYNDANSNPSAERDAQRTRGIGDGDARPEGAAGGSTFRERYREFMRPARTSLLHGKKRRPWKWSTDMDRSEVGDAVGGAFEGLGDLGF